MSWLAPLPGFFTSVSYNIVDHQMDNQDTVNFTQSGYISIGITGGITYRTEGVNGPSTVVVPYASNFPAFSGSSSLYWRLTYASGINTYNATGSDPLGSWVQGNSIPRWNFFAAAENDPNSYNGDFTLELGFDQITTFDSANINVRFSWVAA